MGYNDRWIRKIDRDFTFKYLRSVAKEENYIKRLEKAKMAEKVLVQCLELDCNSGFISKYTQVLRKHMVNIAKEQDLAKRMHWVRIARQELLTLLEEGI